PLGPYPSPGKSASFYNTTCQLKVAVGELKTLWYPIAPLESMTALSTQTRSGKERENLPKRLSKAPTGPRAMSMFSPVGSPFISEPQVRKPPTRRPRSVDIDRARVVSRETSMKFRE